MLKVYLVTAHTEHDSYIVGVYSSFAIAEKAVAVETILDMPGVNDCRISEQYIDYIPDERFEYWESIDEKAL